MAAPPAGQAGGHDLPRAARSGHGARRRHAAHALSAYDDRLIRTPRLDRLATEGMRFDTFASLLRAAGYATVLVGKWHLGHGGEHDPRGFDSWQVLEDQGDYWDPEFLTPRSSTTTVDTPTRHGRRECGSAAT